jgi:transketolase
VIDMSNLADRWRAFGWRTSEVDGHSVEDLVAALSLPSESLAPSVVLARTVFGKGVSYMEQGIPVSQTHLPVQTINWHYLPMSPEEFRIAIDEVERSH